MSCYLRKTSYVLGKMSYFFEDINQETPNLGDRHSYVQLPCTLIYIFKVIVFSLVVHVVKIEQIFITSI